MSILTYPCEHASIFFSMTGSLIQKLPITTQKCQIILNFLFSIIFCCRNTVLFYFSLVYFLVCLDQTGFKHLMLHYLSIRCLVLIVILNYFKKLLLIRSGDFSVILTLFKILLHTCDTFFGHQVKDMMDLHSAHMAYLNDSLHM